MTSQGSRRNDSQLVRACRKGDESAWAELIRRYRKLIFSIPVGYRMSGDLAEEIFQRVAVKLFEHLDRIRRNDNLSSWLIVTTRRECQAHFRQSKRWTDLDDADDDRLSEDPPEVLESLHRIGCEHTLGLAFEQLGEPCRGLLAALYLEDPAPSYQEIAVRLSRPVGSLGPTRSRCLAKLRKVYVDLGGEQP